MRERVLKTSFMIAALAVAAWFAGAEQFAPLRLLFLSKPSAVVSSVFLGFHCSAIPGAFLLANDTLPIHVTDGCSAAGFFLLLVILLGGAVVTDFTARACLKALWVIPASYAVAICANSSRIIAAWFTGKWARAALPESLWPAVHLCTGIIVFVTFLLATYLFIKRSAFHGRTE